MPPDAPFVPLSFIRLSPEEMAQRSDTFLATMAARRSVREFSTAPIPIEVVRKAIDTAAQAPSGAHKQPWTFVLVTDPTMKKAIRQAAEEEERTFYGERAPQEWLEDLMPFGTDDHKPFLEHAPALIVMFGQVAAADGSKHYYVQQSLGIAAGMLIAALHTAGLATLTHTPSPMQFLAEVLGRPKNERAFLLMPIGYPHEDCQVPDIQRKTRQEYLVEI